VGAPQAQADSIVAGTVLDALSGVPIGATVVRVEYSGQEVGAGTTDVEGHYRVSFTIPPAAPSLVNMVVSVSDGVHAPLKTIFQVKNGATVQDVVDLPLLTPAFASCRSLVKHFIVVGHFSSPVDRTAFVELPKHVADALQFSLITRLQTRHLASDLQPAFVACEPAQPQALPLGKNFARALQADAFISGNIAGADPNFTVSTYVSDAYKLFMLPEVTTSDNVNINIPPAAVIKGETHVAVLAAIAEGLAERGDCANSLTIISVAEQFVKKIPQYLVDLRQQCRANLPNVGLLGPSQ
jgi:hypothetical protein